MKKVDLSYYLPLIQVVHDGDFEEFKLVVDSLKESGLLKSLGRQNAEAVLSEWNLNKKDNIITRKKAIYNAMDYLISSGYSVKSSNLIPFSLENIYERCSIKLLNLLYENGADIDAKYNGYTGLMLACKGYDSLGKTKFFLDRNADVNVLSPYKENALLLFCNNRSAFFNGDKEEIDANFKKVAQDLINKTKNLTLKDKKGNTALSLLDSHLGSSLCAGMERVSASWLSEHIKNEIDKRQK